MENKEYVDFKGELATLMYGVKDSKTLAAENKKIVKGESERAFQMIREQKRKVNEFFDKVEGRTRQQVIQLKNQDEEIVTGIISKCDEFEKKLKRTETVLTAYEEGIGKDQLFVFLKDELRLLDAKNNEISNMRKHNKVQTYEFVPTKFITQLPTRTDSKFGYTKIKIHTEIAASNAEIIYSRRSINGDHPTPNSDPNEKTQKDLSETSEVICVRQDIAQGKSQRQSEARDEVELMDTRPNYLCNIDVNDKEVKFYDSIITGIAVLPNGRIAVADNSNKCVKLFKENDTEVEAGIIFANAPWGITAATANNVAITQPRVGFTKVLKVENGLSRFKKVKVGKNCYGICTFNGVFIISFVDCKKTIKIVSWAGIILKKIESGTRDGFTNIAVNKSMNRMYLSGPVGVVECRSAIDGTLIHHKTQKNSDKGGIAVAGNGLVVHCLSRLNLLQRYSSDLMSTDIILCEKHDIKEPLGLAYCDVTCKLFVGLSNGIVKVFHLDQSQVEI